MTRFRWLLLVVAVTVVVAGCSALTTVLHTENALNDAGYSSAHVTSSFSGSASIVKVSVGKDSVPTTSDADQVAEVVWQNFHERFDLLDVTVNGFGQKVYQQYTFDQLQTTFGARDPAWNKTSVRSAYDVVLIGVVVGLAVLGLVAVLIVVLATRDRRKQRALSGWPYGGPGAPYGGPGAPYGSPPFGPPGPPRGGAPGWVPPPPPPSGGQGAGGYPMWQPPTRPPRDPSGEPPAQPGR